jgi:arylsulfatase A-like enzyme
MMKQQRFRTTTTLLAVVAMLVCWWMLAKGAHTSSRADPRGEAFPDKGRIAENACEDADAPTQRPNIVFVLIDDLGYGDFSCTGNKDVQTVNIDRLAAEGLRFTQFYVNSPICSPSRTAFLTGQYPSRHRMHSYLNDRASNRRRGMLDWLDPNAPSLARTLKQAGYATAHVGKWHLGGGRDVGDAPLPQAYGFDESLTSFEGLGDRLLILNDGLSKQSAQLGNGKITWLEKYELTRGYVDRSIDFITRSKDRPFYLQLWLCDVHDAHKPSAESLARFAGKGRSEDDRKFFAVLDEMDKELGRLIAAIDKLGLAETTLIVLTGDNGPTAWPSYYQRGVEPPGSTSIYRGRKWSLYEGGIRQPLIVRWKGRAPAGRVDESSLITAVDFFPTLCRLADIPLPRGNLDGEAMDSAWTGKAQQRRRPIYWEYGRDAGYLKPGREYDQSPTLALREGAWKFLCNVDGSRPELYDLNRDPREANNLIASQPKRAAAMRKRLLAWQKALPSRPVQSAPEGR